MGICNTRPIGTISHLPVCTRLLKRDAYLRVKTDTYCFWEIFSRRFCTMTQLALLFSDSGIRVFTIFGLNTFGVQGKLFCSTTFFPHFFIPLYQLNFGKTCQKRHKLKHTAFTLVATEEESCNPCCPAFLHQKFPEPLKWRRILLLLKYPSIWILQRTGKAALSHSMRKTYIFTSNLISKLFCN